MQPTTSVVTSFAGLFRASEGAPGISRVEIPLIQRDFAQGRNDRRVRAIRDGFLDVLHGAVSGGEPIGLDFVYGEVRDGTLELLDGQQRLTTLFLLHWYVASRAGKIDEFRSWADFTYATRPSARLFCERLIVFGFPAALLPSASIVDQPWFLYVWRDDPTIQSMLVMLNAIHAKFHADDMALAWQRLVDADVPAIVFHLLPIDDMGSTADLYIKMNSRGKPLTEFENFKAQFEKMLDESPRAAEFAQKIDGDWADVFWPYRGNDEIVDDEIFRYFRFIVELCEWRDDLDPDRNEPLLTRAQRVFLECSSGPKNLDFLFQSFDVWVTTNATEFFHLRLTHGFKGLEGDTGKLRMFGSASTTNLDLLEGCCRDVRFGLAERLLLYSVLLHLIDGTEDFLRRFRMVRNLAEASVNELRLDRMPRLLVDVERVVLGRLDSVESFNQVQLSDEIEKLEFRTSHSELENALFRLEDHDLLRGSLSVMTLDAAEFEARANAFDEVFKDTGNLPALTGALLAVGDYHGHVRHSIFRFGSGFQMSQWRDLLVGTPRSALNQTGLTLNKLLDLVTPQFVPVAERLRQISDEWLAQREADARFDWRYYLVRYDSMREGRSGIYASSDGSPGFSLCMLDRQQMNSYYRDPYLTAVTREARAGGRVCGMVDPFAADPWFTGYASEPRWLRLMASGAQIRCTDEGFALRPPEDPGLASKFGLVCDGYAYAASDATGDRCLVVPGQKNAGVRVDSEDRVKIGAEFLRSLIDAGL